MVGKLPTPDLIAIGVVGRPRGLKGEVRVRPSDPSSTTLSALKEVLLSREGSEPRRVVINTMRRQEGLYFVTFDEIHGRDAAEALVGSQVLVPKAALPPIEDGEFYDIELIGLDVYNARDEHIGRVINVDHPPANDVLVIELVDGQRVMDLPLVEDFVLSIDIESGHVVVEIPDGLPLREG